MTLGFVSLDVVEFLYIPAAPWLDNAILISTVGIELPRVVRW